MKEEYSAEKLKRVNHFRQIETLYKNRKYEKAKEELNNFLNKYPTDNLGWHYYAKILMQEGNYENALLILETNNPEENLMMQIDRIKCFIELGQFEESYRLASALVNIARNSFTKEFLRKTIIYSLTKLQQLQLLSLTNLNYSENQILDYSKQLALQYIKKTNDYNHLYNKEIDIEKLFEEVEPLLETSICLPNTGTLSDTYLFGYPRIGFSNGKDLNILKVITIHNTHNILTMQPTFQKKYPSEAINSIEIGKQKMLKLPLN